jgi:AraC-like DNA-binding protein
MPVVQKLFSWQVLILMDTFPIMVGPWLYLYIRSYKEVITWRKVWPHFVIFIIYSLFVCVNYVIYTSWYPPTSQIPADVPRQPLFVIPISFRFIVMISYYFLCRKALISYQNSIQTLYSETSKFNLAWVRWLINGYLLLVVARIIVFGLVIKFPESSTLLILIGTAIATPYIYAATYKGIMQPTLWQIQSDTNKEKIEQKIHEAEEIAVSLEKAEQKEDKELVKTDSKTGETVSKIIQLMEQEKLYQETELTLQDLADKIQIPSYQVSQAINDGMKKNFYDLINSYRVEEAKRLLLDPKSRNYTILSVGFEAGFNSKTTFNTVFKKFTGFTPTEFREKQKAGAILS